MTLIERAACAAAGRFPGPHQARRSAVELPDVPPGTTGVGRSGAEGVALVHRWPEKDPASTSLDGHLEATSPKRGRDEGATIELYLVARSGGVA